MTRLLTSSERRYVDRVLRTDKRLVVIALVTLATTLVPILGLGWAAFREGSPGAVGISIALAILWLPAFFYIRRRLEPVMIDGQAQRIIGEYQTSERSVGETTVTVHYLGGYVATLPEHWLKLVHRGQQLETEVFEVPQKGIDAAYFGTEKRAIVLSVGRGLSIENEVPLGLLHLPSFPRWADQILLGGFFIVFLALTLLFRRDVEWSLQRVASSPRHYDSVAAFAAMPLPTGTYVDIAAATLISASEDGGRRAYYICDLLAQERTSLGRLAEVELARLELARSLVSNLGQEWERDRAAAEKDRKPAENLVREMQEVFQRHQDGLARVDWRDRSEADPGPHSLPPAPQFEDSEGLPYAPLDQVFLRGLGRVDGWSGFYGGLLDEGGRKVPVIHLSALTGWIRWVGLIVAPLLVTGLGLAVSLLKSFRDRRIRKRIVDLQPASSAFAGGPSKRE
jgi:hypothetical protein